MQNNELLSYNLVLLPRDKLNAMRTKKLLGSAFQCVTEGCSAKLEV